MDRFRRLDDGTLVFPKRGKPPADIPNHSRDPGDAFVFRREFSEECKYRRWELNTLPCGKVQCNWFCDFKQQTVNSMKCDVCDVEPKT